MAGPREVRGWIVYGSGVGVAFLMLGFHLYYAQPGVDSPFLIFEWIDVPFVVGILAGALAALGLHQALWYFLVRPGGMAMYVASLLMFVVGTLLFYGLPAHLGQSPFLLMFTASVVLYVYAPALSYGSRVFLGIGVAGAGGLLASSLYGPLTGAGSLFHPAILATIATEGILVLTLLRLLQLTVQTARAAPA